MMRISSLLRKGTRPLLKEIDTKAFTNIVVRSLNRKPNMNRVFSSEANKGTESTAEKTSSKNEVVKFDSDEYDDYEPQTKQEKVSFYGSMIARLLFLSAGVALAGWTLYNLLPSRMRPQSLFTEGFEFLKNNDEVCEITGHDMRAFGRDTGRNTEGRRNHLDSYEYVADDGSQRTRVKFNVKGSKGQMLVWMEVSNKMADDQFVYLICQNAKTGRVLTVVDNREELAAGMLEEKKDGNFFTNLFSSKPAPQQ